MQLDPDPGALEPVVGIQLLLTMKTPEGEPLPYRSASAIVERTRLASVGLLSSIDIGSADAESVVLGFGGGWSLDVCVPRVLHLQAEQLAVRTLIAYDPLLSAYRHDVVPGSSRLTSDPGFDLPLCEDAKHMRDVRTVALYHGVNDPALIAFARTSTFERLSGDSQDGIAPAAARVVALVHRSRSAATRSMLHREPIPGFAELQRMETDIDYGGYGGVNLGFGAGIDTDGDGIVNQGTQFVGPPSSALWTSGDAPPPGFVPTTFHGPVHFRGPVVIHDGEFPLRTDLAGDLGKAANFQPGTLVVGGPTFLDPDPQRLLEGSTPIVLAQIDGGYAWDATITSTDDKQRLFGPGSLRVRASSDDSLKDSDQHGAISLLAGRVSIGAFSSAPATTPLRVSGVADAPILHAAIDDGPSWAYVTPQALVKNDVIPGGTTSVPAEAAINMLARDKSVPRASLEIYTAAADAPAMFATEGDTSGLFLASAGAQSPVRAQTVSELSDVTFMTTAKKSPIHIVSTAVESPLQVEVKNTDAGVWVRTLLEKSPILVGTAGDTSPVAVATTGDTSHIDVATLKSSIVLAALDPILTIPHDASKLRSVQPAPSKVAALDLGVWNKSLAPESRASLHTEAADSPIDIFTKFGSSKIAVAAAHTPGRRSDLDPTELLDLGVWSGSLGIALHTEVGDAPVDIFTKQVSSKLVVAAASASGKASSNSTTKVLDVGSWSAFAPASFHTEDASSPLDVFSRDAGSKVAVAAAFTGTGHPTSAANVAALDLGAWAPTTGGVALHSDSDARPIDIYTRKDAPIVVAGVHGSGALRSASVTGVLVDIGTYAASAPVAIHTDEAGSPVDVYTQASDSNIVVAASHAAGRLSAVSSDLGAVDISSHADGRRVAVHTEAATSPIDLYTRQPTSKLVLAHALSQPGSRLSSTTALDIGTHSGTSKLSVHTEGSDSSLRLFTSASQSIAELYTAASDSSVEVRTEAATSPLRLFTRAATSLAELYTTASTSPLDVRSQGANSPVEVYTKNSTSHLVLNANHPGGAGTSPNGNVYIDPDEFRFKGADNHIENLQLASALGGVSHPFASVDRNFDVAPSGVLPPCPPGIVSKNHVALPTGWSRGGFPHIREITITVTVPGHGSASQSFDVNEPYTGWSSDPRTGVDDGTGHLQGGPGTVDYTRVVVCQTTT